jgi:hypothetical protein
MRIKVVLAGLVLALGVVLPAAATVHGHPVTVASAVTSPSDDRNGG